MQKEVIEKIAALITAAFGLIAALAWTMQYEKSLDSYPDSRAAYGQ